jgi:hypothetical protein
MWLDRTTWRCISRGMSVLVVGVLVAGCTTEPMVRNAMNSAINRELEEGRARARVAIEQYLARVDQLRKQGSSTADYLWAVANADGWMPSSTQDPFELRNMYRRAAEAGSVDARYTLAFMNYSGSGTPSFEGQSSAPRLTLSELQGWRVLLAELDVLSAQRCWTLVPRIEQRQVCLQVSNASRRVWPTFRGDSPSQTGSPEIAERLRKRSDTCAVAINQLDRTQLAQQIGFPVCTTSN